MDTKWKKSKAILSFLAFITGLTILVINLVPAAGMASAFGMGIFEGPQDYQDSEEFRYLIGEKLSELMGVATGGKAFGGTFSDSDSTGVAYRVGTVALQGQNEASLVQEATLAEVPEVEESVAEETVVEESAAYWNAVYEDFMKNLLGPEAFDGNMDDYQAYLEEQQRYYDEVVVSELAGASAYDGYYGNGFYGYNYDDKESVDALMADMAHNKNLRYAVIYQNKLLYSNIEGFEDKAGEEWKDEDFSTALDGKVYNFTLWYNRAGDGKVQIVKDGHEENVYGNGVYSDKSLWKVPGYANYTLGDSAQEAVIFLAAAKEPQIYLVRADESSLITQYGGRLCQMKENAVYLHSAAVRAEGYLTAALILLALSLLMRKSRRRAAEWIAGLLGKICLEIKLLLLLVTTVLLTGMSAGVLGQLGWWLRNGLSYYNWSVDYRYEIARLTKVGGWLAVWFWLVWLVILDWRMNGKRQKKPLFDLLKGKDFKYTIQKRLVKRQRRMLIAELIMLVLFAAAVCILWMLTEEYMNYLTEGYSYSYTYDVYEEMAAELGYPLGLAGGHMAWMLMPCVIFTALSVFTLITFFSLKKNHRLAVDIGALTDRIFAVQEGQLTGELTLSEDSDLREAADSLNQIQKGMETALAEQIKSERMKVELVTNVSHDIKTPLTSIVSYVELLRQEEELPQYVKEYIQILGEKAERLKSIVQDVFEVSKAASGQLPITMETLDLGKLLRQTLADMNDQISQSNLVLRTAVPEQPVPVTADGQRLYRVFQNLLQNALRYSLAGSRVYLALTQENNQAVVRIKNTSGVELSDAKDFTERFVRGDDSRTDGGSGLGLSIAKSFTEACGGRLTVETDADLFTVTVAFPISGQGVPTEQQRMAEQQTAEAGEDAAAQEEKPV